MKKLLSILLFFISFSAFAQTYDTLPAGSKPYGNFYLGPDGNLVFGNTGLKYRVLGTKKRIDSLLALKAPISGSTNYIQNNSSGTSQTASFNINGNGRFDSPTATALFAPGIGSFANEAGITTINGGNVNVGVELLTPDLASSDSSGKAANSKFVKQQTNKITKKLDSGLLRKQSYGYTIYENSFFSNLDGLTATGFTPTFNNLTGSIVFTGGATNNTKFIQVGDYSTADLGKELYVRYKVVDLSGYGVRIGQVYNAGYNLTTNSIDLFLNGNIYASMPSAITAAVGDIIELTVTQKGFKYFIKVSINNKDQVFEANPGSPNGIALFRIYNVGGNIEISKIRHASNSIRDPYLITLGDSKTSANDYASYLNTLGPTGTHGGNGASTIDILSYCDRIFTYVKPNYVVLNIGRNDIAYNIPLETTQANYNAIVAKCEAAGAKVIHLLPLPENTAIDQSAITAFVKATYPGKWVDVSPIWNLVTDVYDNVHPSDLGARKIAYSIIGSTLIPASSNYYQTIEQIKPGSILNASVTGNSSTTSAVTGTTNYIPKFSSTTKLGNSGVFENTTGVGIGTTNPLTPLHINKNVPYQLRLENSGQYYDFGRDNSTGYLSIYGNQSGFNGYIFKGVDRTLLTLFNAGNATLTGRLTLSGTNDAQPNTAVKNSDLAAYQTTANLSTDLSASAVKYPSVNAVNTGLNTSAKWQGQSLGVTGVTPGQFIMYNGSNWVNQSIQAQSPLAWNSTGSLVYIPSTTGSGSTVVLNNAPILINPIVGTQAAKDSTGKASSTMYVDRAVGLKLNVTNPIATGIFTTTGDITATGFITATGGVIKNGGTETTFINDNTNGGYTGFRFKVNGSLPVGVQLRYQPDALGRGLRIYDPANPNNTNIGNNDWYRIVTDDDLQFKAGLSDANIFTNTLQVSNPSIGSFIVAQAPNNSKQSSLQASTGISTTAAQLSTTDFTTAGDWQDALLNLTAPSGYKTILSTNKDLQIRGAYPFSTLRNTLYLDGRISGSNGTATNDFVTVNQLNNKANLNGGNTFNGVQILNSGSVLPLTGFTDGSFINTLQTFTLSQNVTTFLPNDGGQLVNTNYVGKKQVLTASGNGSTTTISIAHGMTGITTSSWVSAIANNAASAGIQYVTIDVNNINIFYTVAPLLGTNNLLYSIEIKP